jgi:hypothetical protein
MLCLDTYQKRCIWKIQNDKYYETDWVGRNDNESWSSCLIQQSNSALVIFNLKSYNIMIWQSDIWLRPQVKDQTTV